VTVDGGDSGISPAIDRIMICPRGNVLAGHDRGGEHLDTTKATGLAMRLIRGDGP
jgi:hypothetical protein